MLRSAEVGKVVQHLKLSLWLCSERFFGDRRYEYGSPGPASPFLRQRLSQISWLFYPEDGSRRSLPPPSNFDNTAHIGTVPSLKIGPLSPVNHCESYVTQPVWLCAERSTLMVENKSNCEVSGLEERTHSERTASDSYCYEKMGVRNCDNKSLDKMSMKSLYKR
jgi:hypothetical protein